MTSALNRVDGAVNGAAIAGVGGDTRARSDGELESAGEPKEVCGKIGVDGARHT